MRLCTHTKIQRAGATHIFVCAHTLCLWAPLLWKSQLCSLWCSYWTENRESMRATLIHELTCTQNKKTNTTKVFGTFIRKKSCTKIFFKTMNCSGMVAKLSCLLLQLSLSVFGQMILLCFKQHRLHSPYLHRGVVCDKAKQLWHRPALFNVANFARNFNVLNWGQRCRKCSASHRGQTVYCCLFVCILGYSHLCDDLVRDSFSATVCPFGASTPDFPCYGQKCHLWHHT